METGYGYKNTTKLFILQHSGMSNGISFYLIKNILSFTIFNNEIEVAWLCMPDRMQPKFYLSYMER